MGLHPTDRVNSNRISSPGAVAAEAEPVTPANTDVSSATTAAPKKHFRMLFLHDDLSDRHTRGASGGEHTGAVGGVKQFMRDACRQAL
jgi:hypothetical protein